MNIINLPPVAPILMESTRAIGYSVETAIADIIDNSIAANANMIDIDYYPVGDSYITILDNGVGMSKNKLINAMQYGSSNPLDRRDEGDLGRYGLGLKTASLSQCRILTVLTKHNGEIYGAQWNLNYINKSKNWTLLLVEDKKDIQQFPSIEKLSQYDEGTLVVWQDLDRFLEDGSDVDKSFKRKMDTTREHLSLVFHRFLSGEPGLKKISIRMNDLDVAPKDPFLIKKSTQIMDEEIINIEGQEVKVTPYILPHPSKMTKSELKELGDKDGLRKNQGFYVYRNKRLIVYGNWFRLMRQSELSKLARIKVDIPNSLDDLWTLDVKKSTAYPPEIVRKNLANIVTKISDSSKRTWTYRGKKETNEEIVHLWNRMITRDDSIYYEVNANHPLVKNLIQEYPEVEKKLISLLNRVSSAIPLNALYVDLTSDEKIDNDIQLDNKAVLELMNSIVSNYTNKEDRMNMINALLTSEPFSAYIETIEQAIRKGYFDDK